METKNVQKYIKSSACQGCYQFWWNEVEINEGCHEPVKFQNCRQCIYFLSHSQNWILAWFYIYVCQFHDHDFLFAYTVVNHLSAFTFRTWEMQSHTMLSQLATTIIAPCSNDTQAHTILQPIILYC